VRIANLYMRRSIVLTRAKLHFWYL
jgi:hypothetical protein